MDHKLSLHEITSLLEADGIEVKNRKTLYADMKTIADFGFEVEYEDGYYLSEAPFSLSEIKIIIDSLNSLRNLDDRFLEQLKEKLYSFLSIYEKELLVSLEFRNMHKDKKFINRLEDALFAIRSEQMLLVRRKKKEQEEIAPVFIYRQNDYYYLYYHYPESDRIYHMRFDNILSMKISEHRNDLLITKEKIIDHIEESSRAYSGKQSELILFEICNDSDTLKARLQDDFPNLIFTKDGFSIRASISDVFFSKLTAYGEDIKISDPKIAEQYISFLNRIIIRNSSDHSNT